MGKVLLVYLSLPTTISWIPLKAMIPPPDNVTFSENDMVCELPVLPALSVAVTYRVYIQFISDT